MDDVVVSGLFKPKSTVSGNDEQSVRHLILDTKFEDQAVEVSVDVTADNYVLGIWK